MGHLFFISVLLMLLNYVNSENSTSDSCELKPWDAGPWGTLLEEWVTTPVHNERQGRIMLLPQKGYYVSDRIDGPLVPPPPRGYDEWPATPPPPPGPGKIVNRPPNPYKDKFKPSYPPSQHPKPYPNPPPKKPNSVDRVDETHHPHKQVSETDLYLLGAIEKLVYRVDLMEKRLRKMEESMHYLVAGADNNKPEPCAANFTRVSSACYHFSSELYDWKTANLACRKLRSNLLELDSDTEKRQLLAYMNAEKRLQGYEWWTGGLNPGLLWIWSNSARAVEGNNTKSSIAGEGRCLSLVYDAALRSHAYKGHECALRHRFVCEKDDDVTALSNEIERVARNLPVAALRKPKIMWDDLTIET